MMTFILSASLSFQAEQRLQTVRRRAQHGDVQNIVLFDRRAAGRNQDAVAAADRDDVHFAEHGQFVDGPAFQHDRRLGADDLRLAVAQHQNVVELVVAEHVHGSLDAPGGCGNGLNAEAAVDGRTARIIEPADDAGNAVGIPGQLADQSVRVVQFAAGDQCVRTADAGLFQNVAVKADAGDLDAVKVPAQKIEGFRITVDDCDLFPLLFQHPGKSGTEFAAADDDHFHLSFPFLPAFSGGQCIF